MIQSQIRNLESLLIIKQSQTDIVTHLQLLCKHQSVTLCKNMSHWITIHHKLS